MHDIAVWDFSCNTKDRTPLFCHSHVCELVFQGCPTDYAGKTEMTFYEKNSSTCFKRRLEAVNYYHKELHLGRCSSPRSASVFWVVSGCFR